MSRGLNWSFYGSSLVSAYWNGAATYYRGILKALSEHGHTITFYEPDAYDRQKNRDIADPTWAKVVVYDPTLEALEKVLHEGSQADIIIKASGVGIFDEDLEKGVLDFKNKSNLVAFWDVDAPDTLDRMEKNSEDYFRSLVPQYDLIFTYGGGDPVVKKYKEFGAKDCIPIYNALDPTTHYPAAPDARFEGELGFLGNRLPDREKRVEDFFLHAVEKLPERKFLLGGSGWQDKPLPKNLNYLGHIYTHEHNAFNSSPKTVLNLCRNSMAAYGFSPPTRIFEAAGAAACIMTDAWEGIELFLEPEKEVIVVQNGDEIADKLNSLSTDEAKKIANAGYRRILSEHTYLHRAEKIENVLSGRAA
jgi:spore maturation protein CgeB